MSSEPTAAARIHVPAEPKPTAANDRRIERRCVLRVRRLWPERGNLFYRQVLRGAITELREVRDR